MVSTSRMRIELAAPLALWLAARILVTGVALVTQYLQPGHGLWSSPDPGWLFRVLFAWDSSYYLQIAAEGYPSGAVTPLHAFLPGYPLTARGVAWLLEPAGPTEQALVVALWLVPLVASAGAAVLMWHLARDHGGRRVAALATALLVAGPYSVFLAASYAESLFLVLALGAWLAATRERWLLAGVLAALAGAVRPNGIMLAAALAVMYVVQCRAHGRPLLSPSLAGVVVAPLGALAHVVYLYSVTGSVTAWTQAQELGWGRTTQWPWLTFYQTAGRVLYASTPDRQIQFALDICFAFVLVAGVVVYIRRRSWPEATYVGLTALALMTSFTYVSLARTTVLMFPLMIAVAGVRSPRYRRLPWVVLALGLVLLVFNTHQFTLGLWAD